MVVLSLLVKLGIDELAKNMYPLSVVYQKSYSYGQGFQDAYGQSRHAYCCNSSLLRESGRAQNLL